MRRQPVYTTRSGIRPGGLRLVQLVWLAALVVDAVIALDFIFRAVAAHNVGFAHYIFRINGWLIAPFAGIFSNTNAHGVATLRWSDVLAFVVYTVAAWIVAKLIRIASTPRPGVSSI